MSDPVEWHRVGPHTFRVLTKEAVLADRLVGFKQWQYTGYGQQALDMLAAFGTELDLHWLQPHLRREGSWDAFEALAALAESSRKVTDEELRAFWQCMPGPMSPV